MKGQSLFIRILFQILSVIAIIVFSGCSSNPQAGILQGGPQTEQTGQTADQEPSSKIPAKIVKVVDGDTMDIMVDGKKERIRLLLVDTPETVHPNKPVEPFGPEASAFAKETLEDQEVYLELDVSERDKYGRLLGYLWVGDQMFNEMLLERGLARVAYVYPPNVKYVDQFRAIQDEAREKELGIWSIENYATDRGFNPEATEGNTPVPQASPDSTVGASDEASCANPTIKGNINSKKEKIYHVPGGQFYDQTKAEQMFCTEEEAIEAGFRKSQR